MPPLSEIICFLANHIGVGKGPSERISSSSPRQNWVRRDVHAVDPGKKRNCAFAADGRMIGVRLRGEKTADS